MGKAAILVGPVVVICVALIVWGIIRTIAKSEQEPKSVRQNAELAHKAQAIFGRLTNVTATDDFNQINILNKSSRAEIVEWAERYRKVNS